ncbi:pentatricopeptide repeat-containing protein At5g16860-like [Telopea speciosissima]|uniref:pentatricopeptide repeat-containing protein At5g16860-like n=1 Tax=Telopea speciosissima TaxID=54955 RepID=UPI001CC54068|nr:pentatricopeptide repeat-containing protein At5g16860-like [Telopea speciosissima]
MRIISSLCFIHKTVILSFKSTSFTYSSIAVSSKSSSTLSSRISSIPCKLDQKILEKLLDACVLDRNLILGRLIHSKIITDGLEGDSFFATKLITLYSVCRDIRVAELVFRRVSNHNVFLLNAMIRGYSNNELYQEALDLFYDKVKERFEPDSYTFSCLLKVCASLSDLQQGKHIQKLAIEYGFEYDIFVCNSLIGLFGKCGDIFHGIQLFERMPQRDIVSWNSIISAYIQNGFYWEAMMKVRELVQSGLRPDAVTIVNTLSVCDTDLTVREMHGYVLRNGHESIATICNCIISMYGKCGRTEESRLLFSRMLKPDKVAWNAVISSYAQNGCFEESIRLLRDMNLSGFDADVITYSGIISSLSQNGQPSEAVQIFIEMLDVGLKPDVVTIASILPAISDLKRFDFCKEIHGYAYRNQLESDKRVRNALIYVYCKCGFISNAFQVFVNIKAKDVISWSSMVVGYVQNGYFNEALDIFRQMIGDQAEPNPITITSILSACAGISGIRQGKEVHIWALKNGFEDQTFVGSALIDMYAKCGRIEDSQRVFDLIKEKNLVTWNSMIGGYAVHGLGQKAVEIFQRVEEPDHISFLTILSACNHGGLVDEGIRIFNSMKDFGIIPREGHYACMVDILGRSGQLDEALTLIRTMPVEANQDIWGALLGACKIYSNLEIGIYTGSRIIELGCENPGHYVLLSNIMADFRKWEDVETMRKMMKEKGVRKVTACSWIEVNKGVHSFVAKGGLHPDRENLFKILESLNEQMKELS